jgi:hypothetical protein
MSILAEFFVSSSDLVAGYDLRRWPAVDVFKAGGLIPMHLEILWAILQGREWDVDLIDEFEQVGGNGESDWTVRFPSGLTSILAEATPGQLDAARIKWAAVEEMSADPKELIDLMNGLQRLAKNAIASDRSMYLWGSL